MDFVTVVDQAIALLRQRGRLTYRTLQRQFQLDDDALHDLKDELLYAHPEVRDDAGRGLVWTGDAGPAPAAPAAPVESQGQTPLAYTPPYLAEKILTSRSALEGERKQVTVLFADLKGSMELLADRDPEEARQLLDPVLERLMAAVHRYEGTVNQVMGDGIMALFGAPVAHEDHAVRACYAALAMQEAIRRYSAEVRRTHGVEVQIRVGLNSGEVVVRAIDNDLHMDYSAIGQTTHLAARMEQLATPGSIRLTAETLRLAEGLIQVTALGPVPVKGLAEPVDVFALVGASGLRRRFQAAAARGLTPFVGRDQELEALQQALAQARAGHGQVVALVGEAGVGKSRLVHELVHSHRTQGWRVLESASASYGKATPYFPVMDLLKRYCHVDDGDDVRTIRAKVTGQVITLDATLQDTLPALLALLDALPDDHPFGHLDPSQRRQRTLDACKRLLLRESQVQPLLLVCEDLHWIDAETQALLESLVESLPTARFLLVVNYRPEYQHGWGSKTYYGQIRLDPLPPASAEALLHALLGADASLVPLSHLLITRTEGNPFFLEESVRSLVETGVLVGTPGAYQLPHPVQAVAVPATVQAVLAARIDRLPPADKRLLQTAAVIGTEVPFPLLQAVAVMAPEILHRSLAHLQAAEFLYETHLFPEQVYTFKHALTQNVAYQSLLTSTRQQVHRQIAEAFTTRFPETAETQPELLAHHYTEAALPAPAVVYWQRAGQRAMARSANLETIAHLRKGLELLKTLPVTPEHAQHELRLQTALASVLIAVQGMGAAEVEQAYTRARELCQQVEDTAQLLLVLQGLRRFYTARRDYPRMREIGEQLLHLGQSRNDPVALLEAHLALGLLLQNLGEWVAARGHLEQALALYDRQEHRALALRHGRDPGVTSRNFLIRTLWALGYPDQALQRSHEAITLAQELAHPYSLVLALSFAANCHVVRREARAAQERAEAAIALCTAQGFAQWLAENTLVRGWALTLQGQGEAGIAQIRQGLAAFEATGSPVVSGHLALLAEAYGYTGQVEAGLATLAEAFATMHKMGQQAVEARLHQLQGELLLQAARQGRETEAAACWHQALAVARRQQATSLELRAAMSLGRLWQQQGKRTEAYALLAPVYGWFTEGFDTADLQEARALLDELKD